MSHLKNDLEKCFYLRNVATDDQILDHAGEGAMALDARVSLAGPSRKE